MRLVRRRSFFFWLLAAACGCDGAPTQPAVDEIDCTLLVEAEAERHGDERVITVRVSFQNDTATSAQALPGNSRIRVISTDGETEDSLGTVFSDERTSTVPAHGRGESFTWSTRPLPPGRYRVLVRNRGLADSIRRSPDLLAGPGPICGGDHSEERIVAAE